MRQATITEAKNGLSALIDTVKAGETVVITDRGIPVARIEPMVQDAGANGRLARLERAGIVRRGSAPPPIELIAEAGPELPPDVSIVEAVLDERRQGR